MQDARTAGFPLPSHWWRSIPGTAVQVMLEIGAMIDNAGGESPVNIAEVASRLIGEGDDAGISRRTVERSRDVLVKAGYIRMIPGGVGKANHYAWGVNRPKEREIRRSAPQKQTPTPESGESPHFSGRRNVREYMLCHICRTAHKPGEVCDLRRDSDTLRDLNPSSLSPLSPKNSQEIQHQHRVDASQNGHANAGSGDGGVVALVSGGEVVGRDAAPLAPAWTDTEDAALALLIEAGVTATFARSAVVHYGADRCRRNYAAWRKMKNVQPGLLRLMIERDDAGKAAAALAKAKDAARTRKQQADAEKITLGMPTARRSEKIEPDAALTHIAALDDSALHDLAVRAWPSFSAFQQKSVREVPASGATIRASTRWLAFLADYIDAQSKSTWDTSNGGRVAR